MDKLWERRLLRNQLQRIAKRAKACPPRLDEQLAVCGKVANRALARADEPTPTALLREGRSGSGARARAGHHAAPGDDTPHPHVFRNWRLGCDSLRTGLAVRT